MPRMTKAEMRAFLARPLIAVFSTTGPDGSLHSAPVWYEFEDGRFFFWTDENSRKARNLRHKPEASVCIATQEEPYQYVTAFGPCEIVSEGIENRCLSITRRYYDQERAKAFVAEGPGIQGSAIVVLTPRTVASERSA